MKIFFVKTIMVAAMFYIVFELTIGSKIKQVEETFLKYKTKSERVKIKEKIITEIERANKKEKILSERDKEVLSKFFKKIRKELETENK